MSAYGIATRSMPVLCGSGFIISCIGFTIGPEWVGRVGTNLFLSGFAVWGLANGGAFLWGFKKSLRQHGLKIFIERPWSSAFYVLLMVFFLAVGVLFVWFITKSLRS